MWKITYTNLVMYLATVPQFDTDKKEKKKKGETDDEDDDSEWDDVPILNSAKDVNEFLGR